MVVEFISSHWVNSWVHCASDNVKFIPHLFFCQPFPASSEKWGWRDNCVQAVGGGGSKYKMQQVLMTGWFKALWISMLLLDTRCQTRWSTWPHCWSWAWRHRHTSGLQVDFQQGIDSCVTCTSWILLKSSTIFKGWKSERPSGYIILGVLDLKVVISKPNLVESNENSVNVNS